MVNELMTNRKQKIFHLLGREKTAVNFLLMCNIYIRDLSEYYGLYTRVPRLADTFARHTQIHTHTHTQPQRERGPR